MLNGFGLRITIPAMCGRGLSIWQSQREGTARVRPVYCQSRLASSCNEHLGLRNESFRNYADYMGTPEFRDAVEQLLELARRRRTAFMCSEGLFWRCHRRLLSD